MCSIVVSFFLLVLFTFWSSSQSAHSLYFGDNVSLTTSMHPSSFMEGGLASTERGDVYVVWVDSNSLYFRSSQDNGTKFGNPILLSNVNSSLSPQTGPKISFN